MTQIPGVAGDSGVLHWSTTPGDCGAPSEQSNFGLPPAIFSYTTDLTVSTLYSVPASGGDSIVLYLNTQADYAEGVPPDDTIGDDYVIAEFHVNPPAVVH